MYRLLISKNRTMVATKEIPKSVYATMLGGKPLVLNPDININL